MALSLRWAPTALRSRPMSSASLWRMRLVSPAFGMTKSTEATPHCLRRGRILKGLSRWGLPIPT